jgi:hypothetical protein
MIKPVLNLAAVLGVFVIMFGCASVSAVPQRQVAARKEVKIYFYHDPVNTLILRP